MLSTPSDDSITLHYQPVAVCQGEVAGFEALMRWHHRGRGAVSPEAFIPIFEESGLAMPLARWALNQACADAARWRRDLTVAVNLSVMQFQQDDLPELIHTILGETKLAPERLELEITEAALLAAPQRSRTALDDLRGLGLQITLDAFGTGSFKPSDLMTFPFSKIKIDRSFVANIENSVSARSIIRMIVELGHSLNLGVAAAGVETEAQYAYLCEEGCDLVEGFLIGRPAGFDTFSDVTGVRPMAHVGCEPDAALSGRRARFFEHSAEGAH